MPKFSISLPDGDSKIDGVRKRVVPICPVISGHRIKTSYIFVQWLGENDVCVNINASIFYHEVNTPDVRHMRDYLGKEFNVNFIKKLYILVNKKEAIENYF